MGILPMPSVQDDAGHGQAAHATCLRPVPFPAVRTQRMLVPRRFAMIIAQRRAPFLPEFAHGFGGDVAEDLAGEDVFLAGDDASIAQDGEPRTEPRAGPAFGR